MGTVINKKKEKMSYQRSSGKGCLRLAYEYLIEKSYFESAAHHLQLTASSQQERLQIFILLSKIPGQQRIKSMLLSIKNSHLSRISLVRRSWKGEKAREKSKG